MLNEHYISRMQQLAFERLDELHSGIYDVAYTDFPDHGNVGDSAIALGLLRYYESRGIRVRSTTSYATAPNSFTSETVVIHGGGNLGDIYPHHHGFRLRVGRDHHGLIIQAPQSVHFSGQTGLQEYLEVYDRSSAYRLGLRDAHSVELLSELRSKPVLAPDAFHCMGPIAAPSASQKYLVLARTDAESGSLKPSPDTVDWPSEVGLFGLLARVRNRSRLFPAPLRRVANLSTANWAALANRRFALGVNLISKADVIVTDRLHAMLIALQMGRSVVAIDNNNRKLQNYAETWFGESEPDVRFVADIEEARNLVH
jgi:exopolysaccharide biosynthesis predicted pyruvyltransferase EpsI